MIKETFIGVKDIKHVSRREVTGRNPNFYRPRFVEKINILDCKDGMITVKAKRRKGLLTNA